MFSSNWDSHGPYVYYKEVNKSLKNNKAVYLSGAFTALMKWNILLLFAVHPQTRCGRIPLFVRLKSHLSHVVKQLRQMLLDLNKQTCPLSLGDCRYTPVFSLQPCN